MLLRLDPPTASLRLSAIEARVQQLPDKYIGTSISIEIQEHYDSGHQNISHIGIQVAGWTSSIAILQKSLKQRIQPPTAYAAWASQYQTRTRFAGSDAYTILFS